ncbi:MAG: hypothetical protein U0235_34365 [Polyangiaceae bacterium]
MRIARSLPLVSFVAALVYGLVPGCSSDDTTATPASTDAGTTDSAPLKLLCGQAGALCAGNEWCAYDLVGSCGKNDLRGSCKPRPTTCDTTCPLVCGCDGKPYCNACEAQLAGSDVSSARDCAASGGEVTAFALYTTPPKISVMKTDKDRKICMRVTLIKRLGTQFGLDVPANWGVEDAIISNEPDDCSITVTGLPPTPKGTAPQANGGQGTFTFSSDTGHGGDFPCKLSVEARLGFQSAPEYSWVPNVEVLSAKELTIAGACP